MFFDSSAVLCPIELEEPDTCSVCFSNEPLSEAEEEPREIPIFDLRDVKTKRKRVRVWSEGRKLGASLQYGRKRCAEAEDRACIFPKFNFARALSHGDTPLYNKSVGKTMVWDDEHARFAKDNDGFKIVAHFPAFLSDKALSDFTQLCTTTGRVLGSKLSIGSGADKNGRDNPDSYIHKAGEITGSIQFAHCQHAVGKTHVKPLPSLSLLGTCTSHEILMDFMKDSNSTTLSQRLNGILEEIDLGFYNGLQKVRKVINKKISSVTSLSVIDPILMEGRSLIFNRRTPLHKDSLDCKTGWQFILAAGTFTSGGSIYLPHLDLRLRLLPGDLVALRGRVLSHEVESWAGGQRISMVNYTHESVWKYAEVPIPHL